MLSFKYRQLSKSDFEKIYEVALEAWNYTYKDIFSPTYIENYVDKFYSTEAMQKQLLLVEKGEMFFEVAEEKNVIGFCNIQIKNNDKAELLRIYLKPLYIGNGVGKKLLLHGEDFLISKGVKKLYYYAHKKNKLGRQFYLKNGFKITSEEANELFDNECNPGSFCNKINGKCEIKVVSTSGCKSSSECKSGELCNQGKCEVQQSCTPLPPETFEPPPCLVGQFCFSKDNKCWNISCVDTSDCPPVQHTCFNGMCSFILSNLKPS